MVQLQRVAIAPEQINHQQVTLNAEQQHYLGRVLRLQQGDRFIAIDGQGQGWLVELTLNLPARGPQAVLLETITVKTELPLGITLLAAVAKGNGFEEMVRCTTELGVTQIVPVLTERTLVQPSAQKCQRWRRIATEAAEQSERQIVPRIFDPQPWKVVLSEFSTINIHQTQPYLCVARGNPSHLLGHLLSLDLQNLKLDSIMIAIGPEGGWTSTEVETAINLGFQPVSLGYRIFRAVTAPVVALSIIASVLEQSQL